MDHLRQAQAFHDRQAEILRQVREAAATQPRQGRPLHPNFNVMYNPPNPAPALPQDSSRLFA